MSYEARKIIRELEKISIGLPTPYSCIANSVLERIRERIKFLSFEEFEKVFKYVKNARLPDTFKEYVKTEYIIRGGKL